MDGVVIIGIALEEELDWRKTIYIPEERIGTMKEEELNDACSTLIRETSETSGMKGRATMLPIARHLDVNEGNNARILEEPRHTIRPQKQCVEHQCCPSLIVLQCGIGPSF
jgi:hypothetical protein